MSSRLEWSKNLLMKKGPEKSSSLIALKDKSTMTLIFMRLDLCERLQMS